MAEVDYVNEDADEERKHNILALSFAEVAERLAEGDQDTVLVALGSTEKHGAHIPLGTDSYVTMEVVKRAAKAADVLYSPLVPFGYSPHHMGRHLEGAGTITLRAETYRRIMSDIARSLIFHGFKRVIFVSHHGSNTKPIDEVMRQLRYDTGAFISYYKTPTERDASVIQDLFENPPEETPGWHSSELETSALMATSEGLVNMKRAVEDRAHAPAYMTDEFSKIDGTSTVKFKGSENIWVPMEHHEYCDTAVIGNPFRSNREKGLQMLDRMSEHLASFVQEVRKFDVEVTYSDYPGRA
ncbi:creatininase family protein [Amycolatopsis acidiphila]|uniref:creatininase family protein n=1 Tax=Amycolatopsis acidiphila TaxID=715473 RepID=UPI0016439571|nr:creatininase family protein [Amycolatopsis acidiphila]UIJ57389.1 creatininase family protein [Amycolatopsis acidiphila]GHG84485.1 creatininase [Amycolatopsis acidiphila]